MSKYQHIDRRVAIADDNVAVVHNLEKCKNCTLCRKTCAEAMGVLDYFDFESTGDNPICIHCGQCATVCPFDALNERSEIELVEAAIADPDKIVFFQTAPAVRVGLGDAFGYEPGSFVEGKMVAALRALGGDYVFDTNFGADITIEEEAAELVERVVNGHGELPQFTSCCPAWVQFCETYYPELIPHLSTAKSPIGMQAPAMKTYVAEKLGIDAKKIVSVCITPCTAKKFEIRRDEMNASANYWNEPGMRDSDYCVTTRELARWISEKGLDFATLEDSKFDSLMGEASGGGIIFGNTGGVMESACRSAYHIVTGEQPPAVLVPFEPVRGMDGVKEATFMIGEKEISVAAIHGTGNMRNFLQNMKETGKRYDFIEVMACRGGCIGGGGQPRAKLPMADKTKQARIDTLYKHDAEAPIRSSFENTELKQMYAEFFGAPLSEKAEEFLHTHYQDRSADLGERKDVTPETCPTSPKFKG